MSSETVVPGKCFMCYPFAPYHKCFLSLYHYQILIYAYPPPPFHDCPHYLLHPVFFRNL